MEKLENLRKAASILLGKEVEGIAYRKNTGAGGGYGMYFVKWNGEVLSNGLSGSGSTPDEAYVELCKKVQETATQSRDKAEEILLAVKDLIGPT